MRGRPPKPLELKRRDGDTRQRGANRHAEALESVVSARRGAPPAPKWTAPAAPKGSTPAVLRECVAARRKVKLAKEHWEYLVFELDRDGLVAKVDQGMLAAACMAYAGAHEAFLSGSVRDQAELTGKYMQIADRMGLSESARAKLPKRDQQMDDIEAALCG